MKVDDEVVVTYAEDVDYDCDACINVVGCSDENGVAARLPGWLCNCYGNYYD